MCKFNFYKLRRTMAATKLGLIAPACIVAFADWASAQSNQPEDIYVVRSVRVLRVPPTQFCDRERTGFSPAVEDQFVFRSIALEPTGRITDANIYTLGDLHACFSAVSEKQISVYAEGHLSEVSFKGLGDCLPVKLNFPEQGINTYRCWLDLSDLPAQYVGGLLTANTITSVSRVIGTETLPEGYTQASIATVRLWKKR
jgi:hypothetical protein